MPSILLMYQEEIFDALETKGLSYTQVSASLAEKNVHISRQSIHSWYTRLRRKISSRKMATAQVSDASETHAMKNPGSLSVSTSLEKPTEGQSLNTSSWSIERELVQFAKRKPSAFLFDDLNMHARAKKPFNEGEKA